MKENKKYSDTKDDVQEILKKVHPLTRLQKQEIIAAITKIKKNDISSDQNIKDQ